MDLMALALADRTRAIEAMGRRHGFDDVGVALPEPGVEMERFERWLGAGYHGQMTYMARHRRRRADPERTLRGVRAVVVAALDYDTPGPHSVDNPPGAGRGWISRYAWGEDYHRVMEPMLEAWCAELAAAAPGHGFRSYVDHGPVLEKAFAVRAGLGWMGKHTNVIHPQRGSWFFLGVILTDLELQPGTPVADRCGSCTACLDACPTDAFPSPWVLDARRCISYLTIELDGDVPEPLQPAVAPHVFGCDVCQDVCPWNRKAPVPDPPAFRPRPGAVAPRLDELVALDDAGFQARFAGTPLERRGRIGLQRTAAMVSGARHG